MYIFKVSVIFWKEKFAARVMRECAGARKILQIFWNWTHKSIVTVMDSNVYIFENRKNWKSPHPTVNCIVLYIHA